MCSESLILSKIKSIYNSKHVEVNNLETYKEVQCRKGEDCITLWLPGYCYIISRAKSQYAEIMQTEERERN
jgi:hypothetical protein